MEEKKITEDESITLITEMISRTKRRYVGNGNILLMWGYLTVVVTALVWALLATTQNPVWNWLWFLIWIIGGTLTPIMAKKQREKDGVKTYCDSITSKIWSAVGYSAIAATFTCLGFLLFAGVDCWSMMLMFALIIVPFAEIAQGIIIKENCIVAGGAVGLFAGLLTVGSIAGGIELSASWFMPLFIVAFAAMMIVPGHTINHKNRVDNKAKHS